MTNTHAAFGIPSTDQTQNRTCVLVLGMHRSGTSALTRAISLMGASLPNDPLGSNASNQAGHWEPIGILRANERFMRLLGHEWDDLRRLRLETCRPSVAQDFVREIEGLLTTEYDRAPTIVVKDPRLSFLKPLISRAASNVGYAVVGIIAIRSVVAVARSLGARDGMSRGYAELLWLRHTLDAEFLSRNGPRAVVPFESLVDDADTALARLKNELVSFGVAVSQNAVAEAKDTIRPDLRHHLPDATDVERCTPLVSECEDAMSALVDDPMNMTAMRRLDLVRREFDDDATLMLDEVYRDLAARRSAIEAARTPTTLTSLG